MRYEPMPHARLWLLGGFGVAGIFAVSLLIAALTNSLAEGPGIVFAALFTGAVLWNAWWFLFRLSCELTLSGAELRWRTPLSSGAIPVGAVIEVRPSRMSSAIVVFDVSEGRGVMTFGMPGLKEFVDALQALRPDLPVRVGWQARLAERPSVFRRRADSDPQ